MNRAVVISSVIVSIISIARLLIVSNYQTPTAIALADSSGTVSTLTGTLVPLVPLFLPLTTQILALWALVAVISGSELRGSLTLATTIAFVATILVTPTKRSIQDISYRSFEMARVAGTWLLVFLFLLSIVAIFMGLRAQIMTFLTVSGFVVMLVAIIVAVPTVVTYSFPLPNELRRIPDILRSVWLPTERIGMANGSQGVGYILKIDGGWTTILWDSNRSITRMKITDISSRKICRSGPPDGLPLISLHAAEVPTIEPCELTDVKSVSVAPLRIFPP